jgi:hypothetical protein
MSIASFCSTPPGLIPYSVGHCLLKVNDVRFTNYKPISGHQSSHNKIIPEEVSVEETTLLPVNVTSPFAPERFDTMYWCMYVAMNGMDAYRDSMRKEFVIEKNDKFAYMDKIQSSDGEFRSMMKARSIHHQHVMDMLMNKRRIDTQTCVAIAMLSGMGVWIEMKHVFVRHIGGGDSTAVIIRRNDSTGKYELVNEGWDDTAFSTYTCALESTKFEIIDLDKPLKGFSTYSLVDLQDIAGKVGLDSVDTTGKRKLKKHLYTEISNRISLPKN